MVGFLKTTLKVKYPIKEEAESGPLALAEDMVSAWLEFNTYSYSIDDAEDLGIKVPFSEGDPGGKWTKGYFIVKDGKLYNSNGDDVVELALDASDDPDFTALVKAFVAKYY